MKYKAWIVLAYFKEMGLPVPELEFKFHPTRKWRFDFAWPDARSYSNCFIEEQDGPVAEYLTCKPLAMEVQGGIFVAGRHSRGAALLKEWEKLNAAAEMGYRIIYCQPADLCTQATVDLIKRCLQIT